MDDGHRLQKRIEQLEALVADLRQQLAERDARIEELEAELKRRGKNYRPKPNTKPKSKPRIDRRTKKHRQHPGSQREIDFSRVPEEDIIHHDVEPEHCPVCGGTQLERTGQFEDHYQEDIPEPKVEVHRYRRHICRCKHCQATSQGRGDLELPGAHIGPRVRLLNCYARAHLGISLGKSTALLNELFGLHLSRAGALGHLRWGSALFDPVVQKLLELLRKAAVVHADETGWRINGKNVWAWCFSNPELAVYLIDHRRSRKVIEEALGDSLPGVLVTDFYAAYNRLDCRKQRCLPHLLRELHKLREELSPYCVKNYIQPVMDLLTDAIELGKRRESMSKRAFCRARQAIHDRLDELVLAKRLRNPDCHRIRMRLFRHCDELFTFLDEPAVPHNNTPSERDIRSVAATRGDGGTNRVKWSAKAFGNLKSVIRTCEKQARNFRQYGLSVVRATLQGREPPLPLDSTYG